jgi:hypothetical protein
MTPPVEEFVATEMGHSAPISESSSAPLPEENEPTRKPSKLCLRCFVYEAGAGLFRAECIDLDIGTESKTMEGAIHGLRDAIYGYLMVVLEDVKTNEEMPAAVLRPSPFSHRLHYYLGCVINKLQSVLSTRSATNRKFYRVPYGFSPAHYCS